MPWIVALVLGIFFMTFTPVSQVRGIRLHNPLNIKESDRMDFAWEGESFTDIDSVFEEFISPEYGIRAGARILRSYRRRGVETLADIIRTWAPPADNNPTDTYIENVSNWTGFSHGQVIGEAEYPSLIAAMIRQENGTQPYSMSLIETGVNLA